MSDTTTPPPPKPKPGSLRDRIAAFEKKPESTSGPAPVPRPKPGNISWKPKAPSPPASPSATATSDIPKANAAGGMSASDAKESIGKGGSLKERMAALQGKGAFGAPPPPVAPKPAVERPKWKPPPPVSPPEEGEELEEAPPRAEEVINEEAEPAAASEEPQENDPEEEERQRRAAIAARMARLGGARVGMGPPVFGKPSPKQPEPQPEEASESVDEHKTGEDAAPAAKPKTTAMPLPAAPRRAAPPRKKSAASAKSTTSLDNEEQPPVPPLNPDAGEAQVIPKSPVPEGDESVDITSQAREEEQVAEEDEEARKKRVAEKLAQMGAVNPLAGNIAEPTIPRQGAASDSIVDDRPHPPRRSSSSSITSPVRKGSVEQTEETGETVRTGVAIISEEAEVEVHPTTQQSEEILAEPVIEAVNEGVVKKVAEAEEEEEISRPPPPLRRNTRPPSISQPLSLAVPVDGVDPEQEEPEITIHEEPASPPPPLPRSTRPTSLSQPLMSPPPTRSPPEFKEEQGNPLLAAVGGPRRAIPPPPMRILDDDDDDELGVAEVEEEPGAPMLRIIPATPAVIPPTPAPPKAGGTDTRRRAGSPEPTFKLPPIPGSDRDQEDEDEEEETKRVPPQKPRRDSLSIPQSTAENVNDNVRDLPPHPPSERPSRAVPVPPPTAEHDEIEPLIIPPRSTDNDSPISPPALSVSDHSDDREVLDEDEGDPIDPSFHIPSRRSSAVNLKEAASLQDFGDVPAGEEPIPAPPPEQEEDEEQARRRTIAERMARLGGIRFGAPVPPPVPHHDRQGTQESVEESAEPAGELDEEEEERARKERIAKKLASMGGMRFGMMPMMGVPGSAPPKPVAREEASEDSIPTQSSPPIPHRAIPPPRAVPPPPPPAPETDSEYDSTTNTDDDGVRVEAEESEMEEIHHDEVEAVEVEAPPPPVPSREGRRSSVQAPPVRKDTQSPPPVPVGRPPVPTSLPTRKPSSSSQTTTTRKSSADSTTATSPTSSAIRKSSGAYKPQSDYVMVEEPLEYEPPVPSPPPQVPSKRPTAPPRSVPPAPASPSAQMSDSFSSQWELPTIPKASLDLGAATDLSNSWSDELVSSITSPPARGDRQQVPVKQASTDYESLNLSADELTAIWGRVGVHVCEIATTLYEKSKKALIGDGTYHGFIQATLAEVPMAGPISPSSYGYPIYVQNGNSVQKRASEIMPGDVVWLSDAKLKGHKGLQTYSQSVGAGEPTVGVIGEFEAKKFKLRVFQANQHVGQQTVESVSYRLEDLKSGVVKVFRVMDA